MGIMVEEGQGIEGEVKKLEYLDGMVTVDWDSSKGMSNPAGSFEYNVHDGYELVNFEITQNNGFDLGTIDPSQIGFMSTG